MEFRDALAMRHSCRAYLEQPVEREKLSACLEAGRLAPSSCNTQRWMLLAIDDRDLCTKVAQATEDPELKVNLFTSQIPAFIVMVKHPLRAEPKPYQKVVLSTVDHSLIDIGCAAQQICLCAADLGLGSVILGWFNQNAIKTLLEIPKELEIPLLIGLGYPKNEGARKPVRYAMEQIVRWNSWNN